MPRSENDKLQVTLTLLVLRTLESRGALHGYGLCEHIRQVSGEVLAVEEGSLFPALHRMKQNGWVLPEWEVTDKGCNAKEYVIIARGRQELGHEQESCDRLTSGAKRGLRYS